MWTIDKAVAVYMNSHINTATVNFFITFSHWFNNGLLFFILSIIFTKFQKKYILRLILLMAIVSIFIFSLKYVVARQRPFAMLGIKHLDDLNPYRSFPSGHSAYAMLMMLIITRSNTNLFLKIISVMIGILIVSSRIIINAHYVSDVFSSMIIVTVIYIIYEYIIKTWYNKDV